MTKEELTQLLDLEKIEVWAEGKKGGQVIGDRRLPRGCLVACYLKEHGISEPAVGYFEVVEYTHTPESDSPITSYIPTPGEIHDLLVRVDYPRPVGRIPAKGITAKTFLRALRETRAARKEAP